MDGDPVVLYRRGAIEPGLREGTSAAAEAGANEGMKDRGDCQQGEAGIIRERILFASGQVSK